ncbi:hypothetical protein L484_005356 [Morus notabilis]|uniref:Uncharacterized protein n=1 Tax=Morus notabilis TaxID=981085 RepID=W9RVC6_9ROSA|nr:hypothetical protein L484_005356 [Morus notabilis]
MNPLPQIRTTSTRTKVAILGSTSILKTKAMASPNNPVLTNPDSKQVQESTSHTSISSNILPAPSLT